MFKSEDKFLNWNVVQLFRSVLIVILKTFVINPIYRLLMFIPAFVIFLLHDVIAMPYKCNSLNLLQILSTVSLLFITTCNLINAIAYMIDISSIRNINVVMDTLGYIETIISIAFIPAWLIILELLKPSGKKKRKDKQE